MGFFSMGRQGRILTLLVIDSVFFFVELFGGYAVGSIALIADSFHMLNDVISLVVALYAIRLATADSTSKYSYGWQRAEILGALINGVFLLALCFSIFLECIQRLVTVPEVTNPWVVVIVGSLGLLSNIVGLVLFHDVHGGGGHSHSHSHGATEPSAPAILAGKPAPTRIDADGHRRKDSLQSLFAHPALIRANVQATAEQMGYHQGSYKDNQGLDRALSPEGSNRRLKSHGGEREPLIAVAEHQGNHAGHSHSDDHAHSHSDGAAPASYADVVSYGATSTADSHSHGAESHGHSHDEASHGGHGAEASTNGGGGGGHSHGSMNMQGVFLHVLGDALGNVGVIASGLLIALLDTPLRFYSDPLISFIITVIIFSSALPLVKSASFILLQAVPGNISLDELRSALLVLPGVVSVHELHCWQLSETKVVASVHVLLEKEAEYMETLHSIREVLHACGIHSSTIQPEFGDENATRSASDIDCLIRCPPESECAPAQCCPPGQVGDSETAPAVTGENNV